MERRRWETRERKQVGKREGWVNDFLCHGGQARLVLLWAMLPLPFLYRALPEAKAGQGEAEGSGSQHHHRVALKTMAGFGQEALEGRTRASLEAG